MISSEASPVYVDFLSETVNTRFLSAARSGTLDALLKTIDEGADLLAYDVHEEQKRDALLRAASSNRDPAVAEHLISLGLDQVDRSHLDQDLLGTLAKRGWVKLLDTVIRRGTPPDTPGPHGVTALIAAAFARQLESIRVLLENGVSLSATSEDGSTALHRAGSADVAVLLLEAGADIRAVDNNQRTPLFNAFTSLDERLLAELLARGAELEAADVHGQTPLLAASECGAALAVNQLLDAGALIEARDLSGATPLIVATERPGNSALNALIHRGASLEAKTKSGNTALLSAATSGNSLALISLLEVGANRLVRNDDGHDVVALLENHPTASAMYNSWIARDAMRTARRRVPQASLV
jgi:ankyrin repeat protein